MNMQEFVIESFLTDENITGFLGEITSYNKHIFFSKEKEMMDMMFEGEDGDFITSFLCGLLVKVKKDHLKEWDEYVYAVKDTYKALYDFYNKENRKEFSEIYIEKEHDFNEFMLLLYFILLSSEDITKKLNEKI